MWPALAVFSLWRWVAVGAVVAALAVGYFGWRGHQRDIGAAAERAAWVTATAALKAEAASTLERETARARDLERAWQAAKDQQEVRDAANFATVGDLERRLVAVGRLRDPYAAGCGHGGSGASTAAPGPARAGADDGAQAGGLLSAELAGLLQRLAREADEVNVAYASCRGYALGLTPLEARHASDPHEPGQ